MPISVKTIIHYRDFGESYHRLEFNVNEPVTVKYVAGDFGGLIPQGMVLNTKIRSSFNEPLFNKSNNGIISEKIRHPTQLYLEIIKGKAIKELYLSPKNIEHDLFYGKEGLIYSFYINSGDELLSLKIKVEKDINGIYLKIKASPEDLFFRRHFIEKVLDTQKQSYAEKDFELYPELMTTDQVASLFGREKKTIQNWVSLGKLPYEEHKNIRRFKKSEILKLLKPSKRNKY